MPSSQRQRVRREEIKYPHIVREIRDGWEVIYVATDRPYRVADFDSEGQANEYAKERNKEWRNEQDALMKTRLAIFRIKEKIDRERGANWFGRLRGRWFSFWKNH